MTQGWIQEFEIGGGGGGVLLGWIQDFPKGEGGLTTAWGNGVCPLPRKAEKLLPLFFVTKN